MEDRSDVCFFITAYDQLREVKFTVKMLREMWKSTRESPVVIVISGDSERTLNYDDDPYTSLVHLDDMVGPNFRTLVSTSIMRQFEHGMIEVKDLQRQHGMINSIVHLHGDVLLLGEEGFFSELDKWRESGKPIAADPVGPNGPHHLVEIKDGDHWITFYGQEMMPQLFAVDHQFCETTGYLYDMCVVTPEEKVATEWALVANLHRLVGETNPIPSVDVRSDRNSPYKQVFDENVYCVKKGRTQWGLHGHWGGFCHFGNSIHFSKEHRESRNELALMRYGIDLRNW